MGRGQKLATKSLSPPGSSPLSNFCNYPQTKQQTPPTAASQIPTDVADSLFNAAARPSPPPAPTIPATPAPLTLEQQHITAVEGIMPTLQNIVATVNLDCRLDLKTIALHARNAEYNPKRFAAVIMRIHDPKTTALIFASSKMVVTGAKSEDDSRLASRKYARIVQKLGFDAKFSEFKIQNILFPGLIYRMIKPKVVLLIFVSGKIILTGAKVSTFSSIFKTSLCVGRPGLRVGPQCWKPGDVFRGTVLVPRFGFSGPGLNPSADNISLNPQVREEIYTAFNTIYTVLCEFRKP
ncbi:hypothetical protein CVT26_000699 [Gymnopilus dilepis]|uniref:TATA-box-binding protein n=1 Tax=Gymnopilus dilepis TaxID=231916 RepID=A0A409WB92_9AGAR|nr:hypothetical protein CVT26_000699 [Gymnopilus dilepis]